MLGREGRIEQGSAASEVKRMESAGTQWDSLSKVRHGAAVRPAAHGAQLVHAQRRLRPDQHHIHKVGMFAVGCIEVQG